MMKYIHKIKLLPFSLILFLAFTSGCYYDQVYIPEPEGEISFANNIQPVFTAKCASCHGGSSPEAGLDLSDGNAYTSINNPTYINLGTPNQSLIYTEPQSHFASYSATEAATVLKWIEQGAKNN